MERCAIRPWESVHWDFEDEYSEEGWFEDDYGISLPNAPTRVKTTTATVPGGAGRLIEL